MANTDMRRKLAMMLDSYTVTVSGIPPLSTYKRRLLSLKAFGGTEQNGTPTPDAPVDIISNNGVLKVRHQSGLPLGYKLVDYIKSNAMIELDKPTNNTMELVARFYREGTNAQYLYQSDTNSGGRTNTTSYISSDGNWRFGNRSISISTDSGIMITSVQNAIGVWLNGEQLGTYESITAFTSTNNLKLFGTQSSPTLRLYWLKVYQNGALFYNLLPCQRENDSSYGVYDLVSGQFFTNAEATITVGSFVTDPVVAKGNGPIETVADTGYYGNLVDLNALTFGYYYNISGVYTATNNVYLTDWIRVYNGDTITVYAKKTPNAYELVIRMNIFDAQKNWVSQPTMILDNQDEDVTVLNITTDGYLRVSGSSYLIDWNTVQIIRGSYTVGTIPDYKAYVPYNIATCKDLLSVGDYQDEQEILSGAVTRKVGVKVLDGTEIWTASTVSSGRLVFSVTKVSIGSDSTVLPNGSPNIKCSHFETSTAASQSPYGTVWVGGTAINFTAGDFCADLTAWKQWLADQYAAGTPVIVVYPLKTPTTEQVAGQSMKFMKGNNTVDITQASLNNLELEVKAK